LNKYKFFLQLLGLRIIFRFIKVMEYNKYKNNIEVDNDIIIQDLKIIMNNSILEELKNSYGAGGANNSSKVL